MNWQYITGFFDADGSVTLVKLSKGENKSPQVSFHNNELDILTSIQEFIEKELDIKGYISTKKKAKEHHNQSYELKYVHFPKCNKIGNALECIHPKKDKRFKVISELYKLTSRNGKYTEDILEKRKLLENKFFE